MTTAMTRPVRRLPARARASRHQTMCRARHRFACLSAREPRLRAVPPRRKAVAQTILYPTIAPQIAQCRRTISDRPSPPASQTLLSELSQRGISREDFCQDTSKAAELVGLASQPAIDVLCRKRAPMKRSGSVANGNMPIGLQAYWNYEPKQSEKIGDAL